MTKKEALEYVKQHTVRLLKAEIEGSFTNSWLDMDGDQVFTHTQAKKVLAAVHTLIAKLTPVAKEAAPDPETPEDPTNG